MNPNSGRVRRGSRCNSASAPRTALLRTSGRRRHFPLYDRNSQRASKPSETAANPCATPLSAASARLAAIDAILVVRGYAQTQPDAVSMAKRLHRASLNTGKRRSFHKISAEIAAAGLLNDRDIRGRHCGGRGGGRMWSRICR